MPLRARWCAWIAVSVMLGASPVVGQADDGPSPAERAFAALRHDGERLRPFLQKMPKGGILHAHLSGELDPDLLIGLAAEHGYYVRISDEQVGQVGILRDVSSKLISPATYEQLAPQHQKLFMPLALWLDRTNDGRARLRERLTYQAGEPLEEFFLAIFARIDEPGKDRALQRPLFERVLEQAHDQAVSYLELRINPSLVRDRAVIDEYARVERTCNERWPAAESVQVRFLVGVHRGGPRTAQDLATAFAAAAADDTGDDRIVGVDLVGLEDAQGAPAEYLGVLRSLRTQFPAVHLSLHAGESTARDSHVRDAILLGAERIGHGRNLALDQLGTIALARQNEILIEVSLYSSKLLLQTPFDDHPFGTYLKDKLPLSLNTDDGAIFGSTLTDEFTAAVLAFSLRWDQVEALCANSLEFSFARPADKQALIERWRGRWKAFEKQPPVGH